MALNIGLDKTDADRIVGLPLPLKPDRGRVNEDAIVGEDSADDGVVEMGMGIGKRGFDVLEAGECMPPKCGETARRLDACPYGS